MAAENLFKIYNKWIHNVDRHNYYEELYKYSCEMYNFLENNNLYEKLNDISNNINAK